MISLWSGMKTPWRTCSEGGGEVCGARDYGVPADYAGRVRGGRRDAHVFYQDGVPAPAQQP